MEKNKNFRCAILYHNYYSAEGVTELREKIRAIGDPGILLLCSLSERLGYTHEFVNTPSEKFLLASNMGKDIGGKLLLMDLFMRLYSDIPYIIFLHDKRSYQKFSGAFEKETLFSILEPDNYRAILGKFEAESRTGIICHKNTLKSEYNPSTDSFDTPNASLLRPLMEQYSISVKDYHFVAGTMFWARSKPMVEFFSAHNPVDIRGTLESGNVLDDSNGTITHCWERLLSWIPVSKGYKIQSL